MSYDIDPNALASALPAGITYDSGHAWPWNAQRIAEFQAFRLAKSGYRLVYVGDDYTTRQAVQALAEDEAGDTGGDPS